MDALGFRMTNLITVALGVTWALLTLVQDKAALVFRCGGRSVG